MLYVKIAMIAAGVGLFISAPDLALRQVRRLSERASQDRFQGREGMSGVDIVRRGDRSFHSWVVLAFLFLIAGVAL